MNGLANKYSWREKNSKDMGSVEGGEGGVAGRDSEESSGGQCARRCIGIEEREGDAGGQSTNVRTMLRPMSAHIGRVHLHGVAVAASTRLRLTH